MTKNKSRFKNDPPHTHESATTLAVFRPWGIDHGHAARGIRRKGSERVKYPSRRRIRLVAYGAGLESQLGVIPQGFKSLILR